MSDICGETVESLGYEDPDFGCKLPEYANEIIFSVRVKQKLKRIIRKLFDQIAKRFLGACL